MHEQEAARQPFCGLAPRSTQSPEVVDFFSGDWSATDQASVVRGSGAPRCVTPPGDSADAGQKKGPRQCRSPFLNLLTVRPDRRHFACRRRPEISKTNPCQISYWHCSRGTVNGAYTLTDKVNRVLTINDTASLAAMRCGSGVIRRVLRSVRKTVEVFQDDNLGRHRSRGWPEASWFPRLQCLPRPRQRPNGAPDRSSI